jgi:glucan phosphoethanolaminetransferase (alkaline phosphatase superfamily)
MNENYSDFDKLAKQYEFPKKPRLGTIGDWLLILFFALLSAVCLYIRTKSSFFQILWIVSGCIAVLCFAILVISVWRTYATKKREYHLAQENFETYRKFKAAQFIAQNAAKKREDEMYISWLKKHPGKRRLPRWVEEGILYKSSLTIQQYLEIVGDKEWKRGD